MNATLKDFVRYCEEHPRERFWQALRNWSGFGFILIRKKQGGGLTDTFYFEGRAK